MRDCGRQIRPHRKYCEQSGSLEQRRQARRREELLALLAEGAQRQFATALEHEEPLRAIADAVAAGQMDAYTAAAAVLAPTGWPWHRPAGAGEGGRGPADPPAPPADRHDLLDLAKAAAEAAADRQATDVVLLDLQGMGGFADYFVICTGATERQRQAVADAP